MPSPSPGSSQGGERGVEGTGDGWQHGVRDLGRGLDGDLGGGLADERFYAEDRPGERKLRGGGDRHGLAGERRSGAGQEVES